MCCQSRMNCTLRISWPCVLHTIGDVTVCDIVNTVEIDGVCQLL